MKMNILPYRENVEEKLAINKMRVFTTRKKTLGTWVPKHWHPCFELLYMFCGEAVQEIEGKQILLKQGDSFLVPKGVIHSTTAAEEDSYISVVIFSYPISLPCYCLNSEKCGEMKRLFTQIQEEEALKSQGYQLLEQGFLYQALGLMERYGVVLELPQNAEKTGQQIEEYIRTHLTEGLTLQKVAEFTGYSPTYLSRQFPKLMGMPFKTYVDYTKMQAACGMLEENLSVSEVADTLCYETISSFGRAFKRIIGQTPSRYQEMQRQKMDSFR